MQSIRIERTNGNIPRSLAGEDHISGLLFYGGKLPSGFAETKRIQAVSSIETAEKLGITSDAEDWTIRVLHYQLREIFNLNPAVSLYVGIFKASSGTPTIYNSRNYMAFIASKYGTNIMIYLYITNLCGQIILQFVLPITDNLYILTV